MVMFTLFLAAHISTVYVAICYTTSKTTSWGAGWGENPGTSFGGNTRPNGRYQGCIEPPKAARGHATLIDGIVLHVTKNTLPVYHVVADVRFIHRRSTGMFHDDKEFPKIARGYGFCHTKKTSLTE